MHFLNAQEFGFLDEVEIPPLSRINLSRTAHTSALSSLNEEAVRDEEGGEEDEDIVVDADVAGEDKSSGDPR
jgi:hypothetical protein